MRKYLLPENGNFYKANLHSHSNISDGMLSPAELKSLYTSRGYSVFAYTDHDVFIPHHDLTDDSFLVLSGFEAEFYIERKNPTKKTCHVCFIAKTPDITVQPCFNKEYARSGNAASHVDEVAFDEREEPFVRFYSPESINSMIKTAREKGFFVTYNHPAWSLESFNEYSKYEGMHAMEIFNSECQKAGYESYAPHVYDDMLRLGKKIFVTATDDNHNFFSPDDPRCSSFGGFTMIKAKSLDYTDVTDALFAGDFYASQGPEIYGLYTENGKIHITCSDAVSILFNTAYRTSQRRFASRENPINEADFDLKVTDTYFRITVTDAFGRHADTRAYFLSDIE